MASQKGLLSKLLVVILLIGAAAVALSLIPLSPLKTAAEAKLSDTLGRAVTINSVRLNLMGRPHLILSGVTAKEDPAFGEGTFLTAQEVRAGLDVVQFVKSRQLAIESITFKSAKIDLVKTREGGWSWSTLGKRRAESTASLSSLISNSAMLFFAEAPLSPSTLRQINIDDASVRLRDYGGSEPTDILLKNLSLNASLTPHAGGDSGSGKQARGNVVLRSEEDGEAERFVATLPFDIQIDYGNPSLLSLNGSIGPGPIETKNLRIGTFEIKGEINSNQDAPLTGKGQLRATDFEIHTANLSERVARALKVDQIGDMNPGTVVAGLESEFQISEGTVHTTGLRIQQLDGLGDASAPNGSFRIESALIVNYAATVVLTPEATSRVKSVSSVLGLVVTILETDSRVSVPINVTGDVRNPEIQVDVSRIF